jgi:hypothetical protein
MRAGTALAPSTTFLRYNATDGVLVYGITKVPLGRGGVERDFAFSLESYTPAQTPGFPIVGYVIGGAFAVLAVVFAADRILGGLRRGRRKKFGKGGK